MSMMLQRQRVLVNQQYVHINTAYTSSAGLLFKGLQSLV